MTDAEQDFPDHEDLDIAASEFNNEHIDRMATDLKQGQLERISNDHVEAKRDQVASATGDSKFSLFFTKVFIYL